VWTFGDFPSKNGHQGFAAFKVANRIAILHQKERNG
jgi:hypothetical protein